MSENKKLSTTVGIYTCYGGPSLVKAIESIRSCDGGQEVKILVVADGQPLTEDVLKRLAELEVDVREQPGLSPQAVKIRRIISLCDADILILTQDDVVFDNRALKQITAVFDEDLNVTMTGAKILPMPAKTFFEKIVEVGVNIVQRIGSKWNNGDNYLLSNGRCLAFRTEAIKKFSIPDNVVSLDAYFYFENKKQNGKFAFAKDAVVYNKSPLYLREHKKQSNRYSYSRFEIANYFSGLNLVKEYSIPLSIVFSSLIAEFLSNPFYTVLYCFVQSYVYVFRGKKKKTLNPLWKIDESTKRI